MPLRSSSATSSAYGANTGSYAQNLFSRFNLPAARQGLGSPTATAVGDFYGLLGAAFEHMGAGGGRGGVSREAQVEEMSRSGTLVPPGLTSAAEKMTFLATQRERLKLLLTALDKQASELSQDETIERDVEIRLRAAGAATPSAHEGLKKSKSEAEFEAIEREEWGSEKPATMNSGDGDQRGPNTSPSTASGGGWIPWSLWGSHKTYGN